MPISAFWCASCAEVVDESHYAPWSPCESGITPGHIRNILGHADSRPATGWSVTQLKGCLRSVVIERTVDVTVNPADYLLMELGTAWDHWITRHEEVKPRWRGTLGGLEISGEPDGYDESRGLIYDYKLGTPPRRGAWKDHIWQTSAYGHLAPTKYTRGKIFYAAYGGKAGTPAARGFALIVGENNILDHDIHDGYKVRDNVALAKTMEGKQAQDYPLTGENIAMGRKTLCSYCTVRDACGELAGKVCV